MDIIFLFLVAAFVGYYLCKKESFTEDFSNQDGDNPEVRRIVRAVYNADVNAIRELAEVSRKLQAGGITVPGVMKPNKLNLGVDRWENNHEGNAKSYVVNDNGNYKKLMLVGNDSGGGGIRRVGIWDDMEISRNLQVNGGTNVNANMNAASISTNNPTWNGWISGSFGTGKDRVVLGNLENQATVGAHNNALNAWTALRLRGDSIDMVPNNGIVNYPNGWRINTSDGHFRIQHNGQDKLVAHNEGHPAWAPNGMNIGNWVGEGGGTLNVSGPIKGRNSLNINGNARIAGDELHLGTDGRFTQITLPQFHIQSHWQHDAVRLTNRININNRAAPGWYTDVGYAWGGGRRI
jgi:hypothetical protein